MKLKHLDTIEILDNEKLSFIKAGTAQLSHDTNTPVKKGEPGCNDTRNNDSHIQDNPSQMFIR